MDLRRPLLRPLLRLHGVLAPRAARRSTAVPSASRSRRSSTSATLAAGLRVVEVASFESAADPRREPPAHVPGRHPRAAHDRPGAPPAAPRPGRPRRAPARSARTITVQRRRRPTRPSPAVVTLHRAVAPRGRAHVLPHEPAAHASEPHDGHDFGRDLRVHRTALGPAGRGGRLRRAAQQQPVDEIALVIDHNEALLDPGPTAVAGPRRSWPTPARGACPGARNTGIGAHDR